MTTAGAGRTRPRVTLARVMFWIGCTAVVLAAQRDQGGLVLFVPGCLAFLALLVDLSFTLVHLFFGERPRVVFFPNAPDTIQTIPTAGPRYAAADGVTIRVELVWPRGGGAGPPHLLRVAERIEGGRTFLDEVGSGTSEPLDLLDRGPVLARHAVFGLCMVTPLLRVGPPPGPDPALSIEFPGAGPPSASRPTPEDRPTTEANG